MELKQKVIATAISEIGETRKWVLGKTLTSVQPSHLDDQMEDQELSFFKWCLHFFSKRPRLDIHLLPKFQKGDDRVVCCFWITTDVCLPIKLHWGNRVPMFTNLLKGCGLDLFRIHGSILIENVGYQRKFIDTVRKIKPKRYMIDCWNPSLKNNWITEFVQQVTCFGENELVLISENIHLFKKLTHVKATCGVFNEWSLTKIRALLQCSRVKKVKINGFSPKQDRLALDTDSENLLKKFDSKIELHLPFVRNKPATFFSHKNIQTDCAVFNKFLSGNVLSGLKIKRVFLNISKENSRPQNDNILVLILGGFLTFDGFKLTGLSNLQRLTFCPGVPTANGFTTCRPDNVLLNYDILNTLPSDSLIALDINVVRLVRQLVSISEEHTDSMTLDDYYDDDFMDVPAQGLVTLPDSLKFLSCSVNQLTLLNTTNRHQNLEFLTLFLTEKIDETHPCWQKLPSNLRHLKLTGGVPIEKMDFTAPPRGVYRPPQSLGSMKVPLSLKSKVLTIRFEKLTALVYGELCDDYKLTYIFVNIDDIGKRAKWTTKAVVDLQKKNYLSLYFKVLIDTEWDETQQQVHVFGDKLTVFRSI
ncbi:unnamed protein product [Ambrosiozyma monospora]|uniref:Unnamed protein product n=1 Tax=Ambrosiozyma monospora TaxID=43982 RepID=A0ACB5T4G1_AMBMO|nr:unnamed protein product [Ambrosiozyma monospora]